MDSQHNKTNHELVLYRLDTMKFLANSIGNVARNSSISISIQTLCTALNMQMVSRKARPEICSEELAQGLVEDKVL